MNIKWWRVPIYILLAVLGLCLTAVAVIGVQTTRYAVLLILFVVFCVEIGVSVYRKSRLWMIGFFPFIVVLLSSHFYRSSYEPYDQFRFAVLENLYCSMAEELEHELADTPDMAWGEYPVPTVYQPLIGEEVVVRKSGPDMMIYFPAWTNFFRTSGIVHFTTPHAFEILDTPLDVAEGYDTAQYDRIDWLDSSWASIKLY